MSQGPCFCSCVVEKGESLHCNCGEDIHGFEWAFENPREDSPVKLNTNRREVYFHPSISMGTIGLRGDEALLPGRHYLWEIKMLNNVYGTDVMVGIGTPKEDLNGHLHEFRSLLGSTNESWGFSYKGKIFHNNVWEDYGCTFGKGSIVGVHLDLLSGKLEFYVNRKYMGVAFRFQPQILYPMVSSTAANSAMRLISSSSLPISLQLYCLQSLSSKPRVMEQLITIPGIKAEWGTTLWWLLIKGKMAKEESRSQQERRAEKSSSRKFVLDLSSSSDESSATYDARSACMSEILSRLRPRRNIRTRYKRGCKRRPISP